MNHTPNSTHWQRWDIVIHDADAKTPKMLMLVIGYTRDGLVKTQYLSPCFNRRVYKNEPRYLHDPARFGMDVAEYAVWHKRIAGEA